MNTGDTFSEMSPGRKILSDLKNKPLHQESDPISPTANLKLLTKVASKLNNVNRSTKLCQQVNTTQILEGESLLSRGLNPNKNICKRRKEKSLGALCDKFFKLYPLNMKPGIVLTVSLHEAAIQIGTERRRLYDIVNVLEGLQMAVKVAKNQYKWFGCQNLHLTLSNLKALALQLGLEDQVKLFQLKKKISTAHVCLSKCKTVSNVCVKSTKKPQRRLQTVNDHYFIDKVTRDVFLEFPTENDIKWHSLGIMCQKFMMLFLIQNQNDTVSFDLASNILLSNTIAVEETTHYEAIDQIESQNMDLHFCRNGGDHTNTIVKEYSSGQLKTKLRRLYDIANVLTQLGLIRKVENERNELKKRTFMYTGPPVARMELTSEELNLIQPSRHSLLGQDPYILFKKYSYLSNPTSEEYVQSNKSKHTKRNYEAHKSEEMSKCQLTKEDNHISQGHEDNNTSLNRIFFQIAEMELKHLESLEEMPHKKSQAKNNISEEQSNPKRARKRLFTQSTYDLKTTEITKTTAIVDTVVSSIEVNEEQLANANKNKLNSILLLNIAKAKTKVSNPDAIATTEECVPSISILKSQTDDLPQLYTNVVPAEVSPTELYHLIKVGDLLHLVPLCHNNILYRVPVHKPL